MANREASPSFRAISGVTLVFFAILLWLSCLMIAANVLEPREREMAARSWPEVPCLIREIQIESHSLKAHGTISGSIAYSPKVRFEYQIAGRTYTSDQFWFGESLFKTRAEVATMIAPFQPGQQAVCYVNPKTPSDAILSRQLYDKAWVGWMWWILFAVVGAAGCTASMWAIFFPTGWGQGQDLVPATQGEVVIAWFVALAWNGVFTTLFIQAYLRDPAWSVVVDLFGFPFIGLLLAVGATLKTWQYRHTVRSVAIIAHPQPTDRGASGERSTRKRRRKST